MLSSFRYHSVHRVRIQLLRSFNGFFWSRAWKSYAYERYLWYFFICTVVVVLRPCSCLGWACTVVADNVWKQDGIGPSVDGGIAHRSCGPLSEKIPRKALAKAIPAMVDALCIFSREWKSAFLTELSKFSKTSLIAWRARPSEVASHLWYVSFCRVRQ